MILIIGLFGFISAVAMFIMSIIMFIGGEIGFGISLILMFIYIVALTGTLIRLTINMEDKETRISALEKQLHKLKKIIATNDDFSKGIEDTDENDEEFDVNAEELDDNYVFCEECGYPIYPEDKVCPNCGKEIKN